MGVRESSPAIWSQEDELQQEMTRGKVAMAAAQREDIRHKS